MFCNDIAILGKHRHGTDAAYLTLPPRYALDLPDEFDFEMGALLACNVGTAYSALQKTGIAGGTTLAIVGLGPVGLYCTMLGRAMGADVVASTCSLNDWSWARRRARRRRFAATIRL